MSRSENSVAAAEPPHQGCNSAQSLTLPAPLAPALGLALEPRPNATRPAASFRRRFFPGVTATQWNDWRWQVRNRVTSLNGLARYLRLSPGEERAFSGNSGKLPLGITPYYLSLMDPDNPADPLRRTMVPTWFEAVVGPGESNDPLGEEHDMAAPGLVHRYPDRVLFLATGFCSAYCRYCTRSRMVGGGSHGMAHSRSDMEQAIAYIEATPTVRDVLISGGDPLTMADDRLEWLLDQAAPHTPRGDAAHRHQDPGGVAPAHNQGLGKAAEKISPAVHESALHPPGGADPRGGPGLRPLGRRGHPPGQPDGALGRGQRLGAGDAQADAGTFEDAGAALLPVPVRPHRRVGAFPHPGEQGPGDDPGPQGPHHRLRGAHLSSSTPPAAAARWPCTPRRWPAATAATYC